MFSLKPKPLIPIHNQETFKKIEGGWQFKRITVNKGKTYQTSSASAP